MSDERRAELPAPKDLDASSALIVGGTAGIGLASARALAAAGVPRIVIVGRNAERGELAAKSVAELGAAAHFVAGDATDPGAAAAVAAEADQLLSGIDILMCSTAADVRPELFVDIPTADIARILTDLALPSMHMASAVLPGMRSRRGGAAHQDVDTREDLIGLCRDSGCGAGIGGVAGDEVHGGTEFGD